MKRVRPLMTGAIMSVTVYLWGRRKAQRLCWCIYTIPRPCIDKIPTKRSVRTHLSDAVDYVASRDVNELNSSSRARLETRRLQEKPRSILRKVQHTRMHLRKLEISELRGDCYIKTGHPAVNSAESDQRTTNTHRKLFWTAIHQVITVSPVLRREETTWKILHIFLRIICNQATDSSCPILSRVGVSLRSQQVRVAVVSTSCTWKSARERDPADVRQVPKFPQALWRQASTSTPLSMSLSCKR